MSEANLDLALGVASKQKKNKRHYKKDEMIWGLVFISPLAIGLLLFLAAPLFYSLYISLTEYDLFNDPVYVGLANFKKVFSSAGSSFWHSLINAAIYSLGVFFSMGLALIVASLLCKNIKYKNLFKAIFFVPTICSAVATTILWKRMYDYNFGTINQIIGIFGIEKINWLGEDWIYFSIIFMGVLFGFGTSMLLYISSINGIPKSYYEAAEIDGANGIQKFFYITIPSISPITFYILITGLIGSIQGFTTYQVLDNGTDKVMMPVLFIYKYLGNEYGSFYGYASALAIVLGILIAILTALNFILSRKWVHYES